MAKPYYYEPTQQELDDEAMKLLNDWDDCPKSFGNGFTSHLDGKRSIFADDRAFRPFSTGNSASHTAVRTREQIEANGKNIGTIAGMSVYGDTNQVDPRKFHVSKGSL